MAQDVLKKHYENLLVKRVRSAGRDCNGIEDVLKNIDVLAREQIKYGDEKQMWLDLTTKKMLAKALDPNCRVEVPANEIIRYKETLAVTAYFYWSDCETYAGRGFSRKSLTDLVVGQTDANRIETEFEALVMGAAITRAMTDAGIGLELYADGFEELFEQIEAQDAETVLDRKHETISKSVPNVPTVAEKKAQARKKAAEKKEVEHENEDNLTLPFNTEPLPETVNRPSAVATSEAADANNIADEKEPIVPTAPTTTLSLDEAKMVIADAGQFANQPLGMIYASRPLAIIWLYNNSPACKDAAKVIIDSDETLAKKLGI